MSTPEVKTDFEKMSKILVTNTSMNYNTKRKIEESMKILSVYRINPLEEALYLRALDEILSINGTLSDNLTNIIMQSKFKPKDLDFYKEKINIICSEDDGDCKSDKFNLLLDFIRDKEDQTIITKLNNSSIQKILCKLFKIHNPTVQFSQGLPGAVAVAPVAPGAGAIVSGAVAPGADLTTLIGALLA